MNSNNTSRRQELMEPSQDEIALRAHQLWCQQGCPAGHDVDNWLEAERQLADESRTSSNQEADAGKLGADSDDVPFSAFRSEAPLATKVAEQIIEPGRPASRQSPTSLEVD